VAWVYVLQCSDGSLYVGATTDLAGRISEHQAGQGGAYTSRRHPVVLVHSEEFADLRAAVARERQIKSWARQKKQALIRGDFEILHKLAKRTSRKL
jgi:predicted GIY-YIG superfamily endonuclease